MSPTARARSDEEPPEERKGGAPERDAAAVIPVPSAPLRRAARRVAESWDDLSSGWMAAPDEATAALDRILKTVEGRAVGVPVDGEGEATSPARPLLHHRLAEALRVELLREWSGADGPDEEAAGVLALVSALEEYRSGLWPGGMEDPASRLAEPDAFELIVELAHDLRSPLNSILFLSEVLRSGQSGGVSDHQKRQLGLIYSATLGMISVVSDVMDLAGDYRGIADEEPAPFSLGQVFDSVREMVTPMADEKGIELDFRLPEYDRCTGHPGPLGRVLLNLTTNALKFTEEGGVTVTAEKVARDRIEFSVRDTGRGIPEEKQALLFQPFRKSENREGYFFSGSGLGLSIARRLVAAMDSELRLESAPGEGTRFYFQVALPPASTI